MLNYYVNLCTNGSLTHPDRQLFKVKGIFAATHMVLLEIKTIAYQMKGVSNNNNILFGLLSCKNQVELSSSLNVQSFYGHSPTLHSAKILE